MVLHIFFSSVNSLRDIRTKFEPAIVDFDFVRNQYIRLNRIKELKVLYFYNTRSCTVPNNKMNYG